jgi:ABC-type bacteriocin/lantibiotic exporter with double-glycine peptidase domain
VNTWLLSATLVLLADDATRDKAMPNPDLVCGPRCVQMILSYYGQEVDLMELVKEIQWPELEKGSSMADLQRALNKRGIYTYAMKMSADARLNWRHPVIAFLPANGKLGHFAVRMPAVEENMENLWLGIGTAQAVRSEDLAPMCEVMLLTSGSPIERPDDALAPRTLRAENVRVGIAALLGLGLVLLIWQRRNRKSSQCDTLV